MTVLRRSNTHARLSRAILLMGGMAMAPVCASAQVGSPAEQQPGPHPAPAQPLAVPKPPDTTPGAPPPLAEPLKASDQQILASLKGLVLIDNIKDLQKGGSAET